MKYKVVDKKRLNVYLTKNDLQKEKVTIEELVEGQEKSVVRIKKIFKVVCKLAHFNIKNETLNFVLMPVVDGALIISAGICNTKSDRYEETIFAFENFENVLDACYAIKSVEYSSLYYMNGKYYMYIKMSKIPESNFNNICAIFSEYGERRTENALFVAEQGKTIVKIRAVEEIIKNFL